MITNKNADLELEILALKLSNLEHLEDILSSANLSIQNSQETLINLKKTEAELSKALQAEIKISDGKPSASSDKIANIQKKIAKEEKNLLQATADKDRVADYLANNMNYEMQDIESALAKFDQESQELKKSISLLSRNSGVIAVQQSMMMLEDSLDIMLYHSNNISSSAFSSHYYKFSQIQTASYFFTGIKRAAKHLQHINADRPLDEYVKFYTPQDKQKLRVLKKLQQFLNDNNATQYNDNVALILQSRRFNLLRHFMTFTFSASLRKVRHVHDTNNIGALAILIYNLMLISVCIKLFVSINKDSANFDNFLQKIDKSASDLLLDFFYCDNFLRILFVLNPIKNQKNLDAILGITPQLSIFDTMLDKAKLLVQKSLSRYTTALYQRPSIVAIQQTFHKPLEKALAVSNYIKSKHLYFLLPWTIYAAFSIYYERIAQNAVCEGILSLQCHDSLHAQIKLLDVAQSTISLDAATPKQLIDIYNR